MKAALLAIPLALAALVVGAVVIWSLSRAPRHKDAASVPSAAEAAPGDRYAQAAEDSRRLARTLVAGDNLAGLSAAVAVNGEIVWAEGFGWAIGDGKTPITPRTRFRLGALSKPFTAMAAARLHDQGRLDLDAPVQRYVPGYPAKAWPVTTRQLLGDVAGVHRIRGDNNDSMPVEHCASLDEAVALVAGDPLLSEPGTQHRYSIYGWILVSAVVAGASGEPLARFMARQVFEPLAMERTVVSETRDLDGVTALSPHSVFGKRLGVQEARRPDYSCLAGAGAFLSTPTDLVRLGSATLKPGLLKAETIAEGGRLPLTLHGAHDPIPIIYEPPAASAQLKSAVLLAALSAPGETTVLEKEATRDHTEKMLVHYGARLSVTPHGEHGRRVVLKGQPELSAASVRVPADPSSAAFPMAAALIVPGSDIVLEGVMTNPLRTGLFTTLREMGASIEMLDVRNEGGEEVADIRVRASQFVASRCRPSARPR